MKDLSKEVLGFIPARGGSKTVPMKNIALLNGHPLVAYVINAGEKSKSIKRLICSTEDRAIAAVCSQLGSEVTNRPAALTGDNVNILDVLLDYLKTLEKKSSLPFAIALLQPTSPFVLPEHIDNCVNVLKESHVAGSVQTISTIPHNYHAYNQRVVENGVVWFRFRNERAVCYNKQTKPPFYAFGNLVITKTKELIEKRDIFASPSLACQVPLPYALDVDGPEDFNVAEAYIRHGQVNLPEMK